MWLVQATEPTSKTELMHTYILTEEVSFSGTKGECKALQSGVTEKWFHSQWSYSPPGPATLAGVMDILPLSPMNYSICEWKRADSTFLQIWLHRPAIQPVQQFEKMWLASCLRGNMCYPHPLWLLEVWSKIRTDRQRPNYREHNEE